MIPAILAAHVLVQDNATEITVYNQGLGFVKDVRTVDFKAGLQQFVIDDVAQLIDATSVGFRCLSNPGSISVLEQNYQYDLLSPESILQKSVGKRIRFTRTMGNRKESIDGVLVSSPTSVTNTGDGSEYSYNGLVIKTDDGRIILSPEGEIEVMEIPEGLITKPSLVWQLDSATGQRARVELSYLTKGLSWNANYVLTLGGKGTGDLQGWVTLNNQSGLSFKNANLKLLAGDINVLTASNGNLGKPRYAYGAAARDGEAAFKEESLFEYHLYTLQRPATVKNKESKQLSLLEGFDVPVRKVIQFDSEANAATDSPEGDTQELRSAVMVKFTNNEKSHLGMPMPAGKIRVYQRDDSGSVQFLGENQIQHTPRDERVSLTIGSAFDVKATRKRTNYTKLGRNSARISYEIEVRNRKKVAETVSLVEHAFGGLFQQWKITSSSDPFTKIDAGTFGFEVGLKAGEVKTVKYTAEVKW